MKLEFERELETELELAISFYFEIQEATIDVQEFPWERSHRWANGKQASYIHDMLVQYQGYSPMAPRTRAITLILNSHQDITIT